MRFVCPACRKVNSSQRQRCMYCEGDLAGATLASDNVPEYLQKRPRRFPWGLLMLVGLAVMAAAAYFGWVEPNRRGALAAEAPIEKFHAADLALDRAAVVTAVLDRFEGSAALWFERDGKVLQRTEGAGSRLELVEPLEPGRYRVVVDRPEAGGRLRVWTR